MKLNERLIWSLVFMRILKRNLHNENFNAHFPSIMMKFECRFSDVLKAVHYASRSEDGAYNFFESEFSRLTDTEQLSLTGKTRKQWLDYDYATRNKTPSPANILL